MSNFTKILKVLSAVCIIFDDNTFHVSRLVHVLCIYVRICLSSGRPNISRLTISNVGSVACSTSMRIGSTNCAMFTVVVYLCRSLA